MFDNGTHDADIIEIILKYISGILFSEHTSFVNNHFICFFFVLSLLYAIVFHIIYGRSIALVLTPMTIVIGSMVLLYYQVLTVVMISPIRYAPQWKKEYMCMGTE